MSSSVPSPAALRALRERYLAHVPRTLAALRTSADRLERSADAPAVLTELRRELHRVRGSAGTYGFREAGALCGALEERVVGWSSDPAADVGERARLLRDMTGALALALGLRAGAPDAPSGATPAEDATDGDAPGGDASYADAAYADAAHADAARDAVPDVVYVEDDRALAAMLAFTLDTAGVTHRGCASGPEALALLQALPPGVRPPVVLLDIDLPGLDGHSVHERLSVERPDEFPVVFMTAHSGEADQLRAYRHGALDFVVKPVSLRVLLAKLPVWLARRDG